MIYYLCKTNSLQRFQYNVLYPENFQFHTKDKTVKEYAETFPTLFQKVIKKHKDPKAIKRKTIPYVRDKDKPTKNDLIFVLEWLNGKVGNKNVNKIIKKAKANAYGYNIYQ